MTKELIERLLTEHAAGNFLRMSDLVKTLNDERAEAASIIRLLVDKLRLASESLEDSSNEIRHLHDKLGKETISGHVTLEFNRRVINLINRQIGD